MEIKKDFKNELLQRREVQILAECPKTPSFAEVSKTVSEKFKAPEENIMVENVTGKYGRNTFLLQASIYDTKELKDAAFKSMTKVKKTAAPAA